MTTQALSPARCSAVLALQQLRSRRASGSFEFEIADYAIDLVLNDRRPESDFLVVNALKDARSVLIRQKRRLRTRGMLPLDETAIRLGISREYVKKLRGRIRSTAVATFASEVLF